MTATVPTGAKLDAVVLWAVGYYNKEPGYTSSPDLEGIIHVKLGFNDRDQMSEHDQRKLPRALQRLQDAGLVTFDTGTGYRLAGIEPRESE